MFVQKLSRKVKVSKVVGLDGTIILKLTLKIVA